MKTIVLYSAADGTTLEMVIEGPRISNQLFPDGRANVVVQDEQAKVIRTVLFAKVHLIDTTTE